MKDHYNKFMALNADAKKQAYIQACQKTLVVWEALVKQGKELSYRDSIVGMKHTINSNIPKLALQAIICSQPSQEISNVYLEPITALQDMDWRPPENIEFAYYAIYNLYRKYCEGIEIDDWLIINQCISAQVNKE
jgi:hypothetical protein